MEIKKYKIVGFIMPKEIKEWQEFNDNAMMNCPININPYYYIEKTWIDIAEHWLVYIQKK